MVKFFNVYYFLYILVAIAFFFILFLTFKNKDKEKQNRLIIVLLFLNLFIHLTKIFFEPYRSGLPDSIRFITFDNICAVSTLVFPFFYLSKKRILRDYMFYFGIYGGLAAMFIPTGALNDSPFTYDVIRFYFGHMILFIAPMLMVLFKLHKIDYKKYWHSLISFVVILIVIMINEYLLILLGWSDKTLYFDREYRNSSFIFGPTPMFDQVGKYIIDPFVPKFLKKDYFNLGITDFYFPILWMTFIIIIHGSILLGGLASIFDFQSIKADWLQIKNKQEKGVNT